MEAFRCWSNKLRCQILVLTRVRKSTSNKRDITNLCRLRWLIGKKDYPSNFGFELEFVAARDRKPLKLFLATNRRDSRGFWEVLRTMQISFNINELTSAVHTSGQSSRNLTLVERWISWFWRRFDMLANFTSAIWMRKLISMSPVLGSFGDMNHT